MVAGPAVSRNSTLASMMTRQLGSSTDVAQSQAPSQVPMTVQANSTLASRPSSARMASALAIRAQPSPKAMRSAVCASVSQRTVSGTSAASKDEVKVLRRDGGGMNVRTTMHGSVHLPISPGMRLQPDSSPRSIISQFMCENRSVHSKSHGASLVFSTPAM